LLASKLQFLNGTASRRPGMALRILTGRDADPLTLVGDAVYSEEPINLEVARVRYAARTVYLSERHVGDVDYIIEAWQRGESRSAACRATSNNLRLGADEIAPKASNTAPRRLTRSAVVRRAVEYLRAAVEADPAQFLLEND
jgi:hypothetical protein